jgi:glutamyl-tRNA reductase
MINLYKVITFTHHHIDVAQLGKYQIAASEGGELDDTIDQLKKELGIDEIIYLSTCNRVTYIFTSKEDINYQFVASFMGRVNPILSEKELTEIENIVGVYEGVEAIQHIFEVACSVDSLVVGESEIFHQFRNAFNDASKSGNIGDNLRLLEKVTVQVAKKIYSHTRINEKPLSIASLAGQAIMEGHGGAGKTMLIGAGETNTLVAKFLLKHGYSKMDVYNRSIENAKKLAQLTEGNGYGLEDLDGPKSFDIIVVCTGANQPVLTSEIYNKIVGDNTSPKTIVDLSVPANVSAEVAQLEGVEYVSIDSLKVLAEKNLSFRKQEIKLAKNIIQDALTEFETIYAQRQIELALKDLPKELAQVKSKILDTVFKDKLSSFNEQQLGVLHDILDYMESKAIAIPMKLAKSIV